MKNELRKQIKRILSENIGSNVLEINRDLLFNSNNWNQETKPFSYPDLDENLIYIATYNKGKISNPKNIRLLMKGVNSGKEYMIFVSDDFLGSFLSHIDKKFLKQIDGDKQLKYKAYNYYLQGSNPSDVNTVLNSWKTSDKPLPYVHSSFKIKDIPDYTYLFKFGGNTY